jgi:hypothetical protein
MMIFDISEFKYNKNTRSLTLNFVAEMDPLVKLKVKGKYETKEFVYTYHMDMVHFYTDHSKLFLVEIRYA